ncbi:DUF1284 domain-containing protein [Radicibacter daui]|uniref:DUF1284 domain-containing protein n=1 Tax=Radicibacter daui TaxID=3064829 RepID=UPI004046A2BC
MTVRLRPHHLLCLLTYVGKGYSPAFTANYDAVAVRLAKGEEIQIVAGPDDICAPLLGEEDAHCRRQSVIRRDEAAAADNGRLLGFAVTSGTRLTLDAGRLAHLRSAFTQGLSRSACAGCEWSALCSQIADSGYEEARVKKTC